MHELHDEFPATVLILFLCVHVSAFEVIMSSLIRLLIWKSFVYLGFLFITIGIHYIFSLGHILEENGTLLRLKSKLIPEPEKHIYRN